MLRTSPICGTGIRISLIESESEIWSLGAYSLPILFSIFWHILPPISLPVSTWWTLRHPFIAWGSMENSAWNYGFIVSPSFWTDVDKLFWKVICRYAEGFGFCFYKRIIKLLLIINSAIPSSFTFLSFLLFFESRGWQTTTHRTYSALSLFL